MIAPYSKSALLWDENNPLEILHFVFSETWYHLHISAAELDSHFLLIILNFPYIQSLSERHSSSDNDMFASNRVANFSAILISKTRPIPNSSTLMVKSVSICVIRAVGDPHEATLDRATVLIQVEPEIRNQNSRIQTAFLLFSVTLSHWNCGAWFYSCLDTTLTVKRHEISKKETLPFRDTKIFKNLQLSKFEEFWHVEV